MTTSLKAGWVLLSSVIVLTGCAKEGETSKGRVHVITEDERAYRRQTSGGQAPIWPAEPRPAQPSAFVTLQEPSSPPGKASEIKIGMKRDALINVLGTCCSRVAFVPGSKHLLTTEVFQPKASDKTCVNHFGEKRFMVVDNMLKEILPGLDRPDPEAPPPSRARGATPK